MIDDAGKGFQAFNLGQMFHASNMGKGFTRSVGATSVRIQLWARGLRIHWGQGVHAFYGGKECTHSKGARGSRIQCGQGVHAFYVGKGFMHSICIGNVGKGFTHSMWGRGSRVQFQQGGRAFNVSRSCSGSCMLKCMRAGGGIVLLGLTEFCMQVPHPFTIAVHGCGSLLSSFWHRFDSAAGGSCAKPGHMNR
jgi:hypothetical protein